MNTPFHASRRRSPLNNLWNMPTEEQAIKAYRLSQAGQLHQQLLRDLCSHWEVSERTLVNILNRKTWRAFPLESRASQPTSELPTESTSPTP